MGYGIIPGSQLTGTPVPTPVSPRVHHATPPGFQANHTSKGNLALHHSVRKYKGNLWTLMLKRKVVFVFPDRVVTITRIVGDVWSGGAHLQFGDRTSPVP